MGDGSVKHLMVEEPEGLTEGTFTRALKDEEEFPSLEMAVQAEGTGIQRQRQEGA